MGNPILIHWNVDCNLTLAFPGLKILYRDPPRGYRRISSPSSSPSRSLSQQKRGGHQGLFHQKSADTSALVQPRTRYWSEGHSNKIHAVSIDPVKSKSLSWRQDECVSSPTHVSERVTTPTHSTPVFRRRALSETRSHDVLLPGETRRSSKKSSRSEDNLMQMSTFFRHSPARRSFSARTSETRERAYTDVFIGGRKRSHTKLLQGNADGGRGRRESIKRCTGDFDQDRSSGSINFSLSPTILHYTGEELEYSSEEHNFSISIPRAALKKRTPIEIQVGLAIHGPFTFPENSRNVSPILWLCSIPDTKFRKPIHVTLPHCIADARPGSLKRRRTEDGLSLQFASANLKSGTTATSKTCGKRQFEFNQADGEDFVVSSYQNSTKMICSFSTKHLSPLCVVASCGRVHELSREISLHAVYCVVPVVPRAISGREWNVHFCVTFSLPTCVQV